MKTSVIGYPRIGKDRELKFASEKFFNGEIRENDLLDVAKNKTYTMRIPSPTATVRKIKAGNLRRLSDL